MHTAIQGGESGTASRRRASTGGPHGLSQSFIAAATLFSVVALLPIRSVAVEWNPGDVFAAVGNGAYRVYDHSGNFKDAISDGFGGTTTGCAFDSAGNLYTTNFDRNRVVVISGTSPHGVLSSFTTNGVTGVADANNESVVFDAAGNLYVGHAADPAGTAGTQFHKYTPAGSLLGEFGAARDDRGTDWLDLGADQRTIFYSSEGRRILRYDVQTSGQLADFATLPGGADHAYALRLLPPGDGSGGLLIADTADIKRLDGNGAVAKMYDVASEDNWFALNLDPNGTSFWSANLTTGNIYRFNIATAAVEVGPIHTGAAADKLAGLCVRGEITAAQPNPTPTPQTNVVADSVADFSGVQGASGWYYGYFLPPDVTFHQIESFSNGVWSVDSSKYWTRLTASTAHGNGNLPSSGKSTQDEILQIPARRWISNISGPVMISGHIAKVNTSCGNGTFARIDLDGNYIYLQDIGYNDSAGFDYTVFATVAVGSIIDLKLSPQFGNDRCDETRYTATIRTVAAIPPTPTARASCTGPGTDVSDQLTLCSGPTWTKAGSPYHVRTSLRVGDPNCPGGAAAPTFTIAPGVEVCFEYNRSLDILNGTLIARGTTSEPILFTSARPSKAPGAWLVFTLTMAQLTRGSTAAITYRGRYSSMQSSSTPGIRARAW